MAKKNDNNDEYFFTQHKIFWLDEGETVEDVLEQAKEWVNEKPKLKDTYHLAMFGKTTFNEILKYIEELKGE